MSSDRARARTLRQLSQLLVPLLGLAIGVSVFGCGRSTPHGSRGGNASTTVVVQRTAAKTFPAARRSSAETDKHMDAPAWTALRDDSDPRVRLHALESWARNPGEDLDPATYALVDPDEQVRARAQEVLEDVLARR